MDERRFQRLWQDAGGARDPAMVFSEIWDLYGETTRHYHDRHHIRYCLDVYDEAVREMGSDNAVEMAVWVHDVIYEVGARDNEARSADWFRDRAADSMHPEFVECVCRLVLATLHKDAPGDFQEQFVVDIDLAGLGQGWNEFFIDTKKIRKEMQAVSDSEFALRQGRFLESLLNRPNIYFTPYFQRHREAPARENISKLLSLLQSTVDWSD